MQTFLEDVRYGLRALRLSPVFTAVAATSLALGIGANTAIFGFLNAVLLRPLEIREPQRVVSLYQQAGHENAAACSYPEFEFYRNHSRTFDGMAAYLRIPMTARVRGAAEQVSSELVSPEYFRMLGVRLVAGRLPGPEDANEPVAVVGEQFWRERLGAPAMGGTIRVGNGTFTVIGVVPRAFRGIVLDWGEAPSLWVPMQSFRAAVPQLEKLDILHYWGMESFLVAARLRPGVSLEQARAELGGIAASMKRGKRTAVLFPVQQARFWPGFRSSIVTFLGALMAAVGLVLLIACFNVANMMLARASRRSKEIAIRQALGAGRARIVRQLLTESLLISGLGAAAGWFVAVWTSHFLAQFRKPFGIPLDIDTSFDWRVLAFGAAIAIAAGIVSGVVPALQASRTDLMGAIKSANHAEPADRARTRNAFLVAQIAFSVLLVSTAGLFVRTLHNARAEELTGRPESVVLLTMEPAAAGYKDDSALRYYQRALAEARGVAGVRSAGLVWILPWTGMRGGTNVVVENREPRQVDINRVSPEYFATAGVPLLRGRDFAEHDWGGRAAVINEEFARTFWPGENPIGRTFREEGKEPLEVAGVVRDGKFRGYRDEKRPGFYTLLGKELLGDVTLEIRTNASAPMALAAVEQRVRAIDREVPLTGQTLTALIDTALSQERLMAALVSGLGVLVLALAAIGIYGVLSFSVARRMREIGIRVALGATAASVQRMVLRQVFGVVGLGVALGIAGALAATRLIASMLYGVQSTDAATYGVVVVLLGVVAAAAGLIPARRAARVDPIIVLRQE